MNKEYPQINCTVDVLPFYMDQFRLKVGLMVRGQKPFKGQYGLAGGYIHAQADSNTLASAHRILKTKVGLVPNHLEQLATFSGLHRDPRGFSMSVAYLALFSEQEALQPDIALEWFTVEQALKMNLAFDHLDILKEGLLRLKGKAAYTALPAHMLPEEFTLPELQKAYEGLAQCVYDKHTFRRYILGSGFVQEIKGKEKQPEKGKSRPAQVYRLTSAVSSKSF